MRTKLLCVSFILTFITFGVFSQEKQEKKMLTLEQRVQIDAHIQQLVDRGIPYETAERRALAVFEKKQRVSTRSRLATPSDSSIWVDRDKANFSLLDFHPIYHNYTPEDLVKKVLLTDPDAETAITNVTFIGEGWDGISAWNADDRSLHYFENGQHLGIEKGLLLATGPALQAEGPNFNTGEMPGTGIPSVAFDTDIQKINSNPTSGSILAFDFVPSADRITFDFIFASEEYGDYSNDHSYNDAFGFFISKAVSPTDTINIARFPNDSLVTISNSNWGYRTDESQAYYAANPPDTTGYSVSLIWNATQNGFYVPDGSPIAVNPQWHIPHHTDGSPITTYDGQTVKLQAVAENLIIGEKYHLKLAISNKGDDSWGSAVFLANLDLGSGSINFTSPYLSGARANSAFHTTSSGYSNLSTETQGYVQSVLENTPGLSINDTTKYKGFIYSDCEYFIDRTQLTFAGIGNVILHTLGDELFADYIQMDSLFIGDEKVMVCYEGGTGEEKNISDYVWGKDTLYRGAATEGSLYFRMKPLPEELNGQVSGIANLVYSTAFPNGSGDTALFLGFSRVETDVKFFPVTQTSPGSLSLGLKGGSKYVRWANIDGLDCDAEYNERCHWRFLRDTITGAELPFSSWELLKLYDGDNPVSIIIQEPGNCYVDTVRFGGGGSAVMRRAITMPFIPGVQTDPTGGNDYFVLGHRDFTFTAKFTGEPMSALATAYYSKTVLDLDETAEELEDGSFKYTIRRVVEPWAISFVPKLQSDKVSNNTFGGPLVWSSGNTVYVKTEKPSTATIHTITGLLYKQVEVGGSAAISLPRGFYIVSVNDVQYKVIIE